MRTGRTFPCSRQSLATSERSSLRCCVPRSVVCRLTGLHTNAGAGRRPSFHLATSGRPPVIRLRREKFEHVAVVKDLSAPHTTVGEQLLVAGVVPTCLVGFIGAVRASLQVMIQMTTLDAVCNRGGLGMFGGEILQVA